MSTPAKTRAAILVLAWLGGCVSEADAPRSTPLEEAAATSGEPPPASPSDAQESLNLSPRGRQAFERLLNARRFTDDGIYDDGITPNEVIALRLLWREPRAHEAFEALLEHATLAGQLFALCGLYYTEPARFAQAVQPYRGRSDELAYQTGCIGFHDYPLGELVEIERPGAVRLEPGESVVEWLERHDNPRGTLGGYWLDIYGGGTPNVFREAGGFRAVREETFSPERD